MSTLLKDCIRRYPILAPCEESIQMSFDYLMGVYTRGGKLLIAGNGGSAADADHISGELLKGFKQKRPLSQGWRDKLGHEIADNLQGALPTIPLSTFNALNTAYANDCNPHYIFAQLTWGLGMTGDALLSISTSGNSKNVLLATQVAKAKGMHTIGLTGATGGELKDMCDICICVPETETFKIQELHLPVYHILCLMLEEALFPQNAPTEQTTPVLG